MSFFKRAEVLTLLALGAGAAVWVLAPDGGDGGEDEGQSPVSEPVSELQILRCTLERDFGNARLDVEVRHRNSSPRPLILAPPDVRLLTEDGVEIPPFILPAERPPQIAARSTQEARLRYWLEAGHLEGELILDIRGLKAWVKSPVPLDLRDLENRKPRTWQGRIE
ncbi:MAG TPA: hypothetical protein DIT13_19595 [Verrucomicrobiales bacterium]|nr:hypothetical protein [Verrucomicrobiales bacterium]HRJ09692.1 hypothetical protein [Prosthecobacter sp.]HRK14847.1 hypothetical protein [Prosthecobacter sp.]